MMQATGITLLMLAPTLPLLLALTPLRRAGHRLVPVTMLPLTGLLLLPREIEIEAPWLLLGESGLRLGSATRFWLLLTLACWMLAWWSMRRQPAANAEKRRVSTWHLLLLSGQVGAVLARDLVSFYAFSTFMGYAAVGLLFAAPGGALRSAGRYYLVALIAADLLLFEALILVFAAGSSGLATAIPAANQAEAGQVWISLALVAFMLRAGLWPAHCWLVSAVRHGSAETSLLLWGGPVLIGLLGVLRWLPPGNFSSAGFGWFLLGAGSIAAVAAVVRAIRHGRDQGLGAAAIGGGSGCFLLLLAVGYLRPADWTQLRQLFEYLFIVNLVGVAVAVPVAGPGVVVGDHRVASLLSATRGLFAVELASRRDRLVERVQCWWRESGWRQWAVAAERLLQRWQVALSIFLLLAMVLVALGVTADS